MSFDLMFQKANELYLSGAYNQAENIYRQILTFAPENADVLNMLGLTAAAKNEHHEAIPYFYEALKNAQNPLPIYFNLAVSLSMIKKYDEAIEAYENALKSDPNIKEAYNNLGDIYEKKQEIAKAVECYQKALKIDPNYIDPAVNLAVLEKNEDHLLEIHRQNPKSPLPLYYLALWQFDAGQPDKALNFALDAEKLAGSYDTKNLLAQIYLKKQDKTNAIKYFHQALLLNSKSVDALLNLAILEENETFFLKALSLAPDSFEAHISYGDFLYKNRRNIEAMEEYHKAVLIDSDQAALSNNVALVLKDMGDYKGALDLLMNAFLKTPQDNDIAINMAETLILLYQEEPQNALEIARLWEKNAPENVFAEQTLASFENNTEKQVEGYAERLFDKFALMYDERMKQIGYNVLNKIKELNLSFEGNVLDLGCGTGLAAETLKNKDAVWTGVDISENMLKIAADKKLYKDLRQSDIKQFLTDNSNSYGAILCLDVLEYIQNYEKIFELCFPSDFILTIETAPEDISTMSISPQGRYQHNPAYIEQQLKKVGYKFIKKHSLVLRKENGKDVNGVLFLASANKNSHWL